MNKTFTIFKREVLSYFKSPLAYVVISTFLVITGYIFTTELLYYKLAYMQSVFENMVMLLIFFTPILTMGLLTEERKEGIDQLLFTSPLGVVEFVMGKFIAAFSVYLIMLMFTLLYPLILEYFGTPDYGPIIGAYIGLILLGGAFISIGLFASSLTQSQVIAGLISFGILILLWILTYLKGIFSGPISKLIHNIDVFAYFVDFNKGILDSRGILIYLSFTFVFLFLTTRVIDRRRWS
ncbi:ABC transporter permease [Thermohalobacter berrensis]|uniref:ABC transporter permease n=1 Tax=Thermohalobacter berrensis TaxID=99594 RepID=A0A419T6C8_9FIRM|nr:ABC transporter permease [Thermohalobacter berrensis]RKD32963.1 ABC transporter permease [Thermohalobacter berrensis]